MMPYHSLFKFLQAGNFPFLGSGAFESGGNSPRKARVITCCPRTSWPLHFLPLGPHQPEGSETRKTELRDWGGTWLRASFSLSIQRQETETCKEGKNTMWEFPRETSAMMQKLKPKLSRFSHQGSLEFRRKIISSSLTFMS